MGSRGRVLPAQSWAVTQGSLGKLERRTQLHQLVPGRWLPVKSPRVPAGASHARRGKGTQPALPSSLLACWLLRAMAGPPHPEAA